jgi:hypothetical protein
MKNPRFHYGEIIILRMNMSSAYGISDEKAKTSLCYSS